jgi:hypothetical protein
MKKILFVLIALCFVSSLAFAAETAAVKPAAKPAVTSTEVVKSDAVTDNAEAVPAATDTVNKDKVAATEVAAK